MLAYMREFKGDITQAVCRRGDVDPEWWIEPDYEASERGGRTSAEMNQILVQSREDQLRAKILCYQCPLLDICRDYAWFEGTHVWGGLDGVERYKVLKTGTMQSLPRPPKGRFLQQNDLLDDFLRGDSVEKVAANHGKSAASVFKRIRGTLGALREERRDYEWSSWNQLPTLPGNLDLPRYRHGLALLLTSDAG